MIFIGFLIIIFSLGSFINHIYKPIVALIASWVFSHISAHRQKLQTRAALLGSLIFLRSLKVLTAYGLSKASASASKSIYLQLLEGVKWHRTLFLSEGILSPEVRNGEQKANYGWRSDDWYSFELPNNHVPHWLLLQSELVLNPSWLPSLLFCQTVLIKWYIKT